MARQVLGIAVSDDLVECWRGWFAPPRQPFPLDLLDPAVAASIPVNEGKPTAEWTDTFFMYSGTWTWLDEAEFDALPYRSRRALSAARRRSVRPKTMPVWPSVLARAGDELLFRWVESGAARPSQHASVPATVWRRASRLLPEAKRLAGTFPASGSGANCFGNVLAAVGVPGIETVRVVREFQDWLERHTEPVRGTGHDREPGTVLYWTEHGKLAHAAVTIGDGWVLNKGSQSWSSARIVCTVRDLINRWKYPTTRLYRRRYTRTSSERWSSTSATASGSRLSMIT